MADNENEGVETVNGQTLKPYTTQSTAAQDLERRLDPDYKPVVGTARLNPNPFGDEEYVGTDPVYQNHANDTEVPYAAEEGPLQKAEEHFADQYDMSDADDDKVVPDPGMGGVTTVAVDEGPGVSTLTIGAAENTPQRQEEAPEQPGVQPPPTQRPTTPQVPSGQSGTGNDPTPED